MSTRVSERVDEWTERPFTGGYGALQDLADEDFSGVVRVGGAELYMTKGTVIDIRMGSIEDFEDGEGTLYEAPTPALPLLAVMQDRGDEVRAEYYSEDTGIAEVDSKLSDGGFTGYIELSENVLSGDYYVVYHQGRSMSVAFVGNAKRLLEGDEAFERANGEVGIYKVHPVDIEPIEIPEPATPDPEPDEGKPAPAAAGTVTAESDAGGDSQPTTDTETTESADTETADTTADPGAGNTKAEPETADTAADPGTRDTATDPGTAETDDTGAGTSDSRSTDPEAAETADTGARDPAADAESGPAAGTGQRPDESDRSEQSQDTPETARASSAGSGAPSRDGTPERSTGAGAGSDPSGRGSGPVESDPPQSQSREPRESPAPDSNDGSHLETRSIPSLDPERTETGDRGPDVPGPGTEEPFSPSEAGGQGAPSGAPEGEAGSRRQQAGGSAGQPEGTAGAGEAREPAGGQATDAGSTAENAASVDPDRVRRLESQLEDREAEIDRLKSDLDAATEQREQLEAELASVREERDELAAEVERLESELERLETEFGAATDREQRITPQEALDGTDIFVRYHSKGDATLEKAHDSGVLQEDVVGNLLLEKHTQFDADAVAVGGETYEEFLENTVEFQFVEWVATELLFEIRDTGHADVLRTLYDALPKIDRAELNGTVEVVYTEDGQESRSTESFDVVYRDRMGDPLLVANINASREAATESMMEGLVTAAERVGQSCDDFAAAFLVTESFFEPGALETASEATRGGLLSRNKNKSFVNLSRKQGYHLCLVEARSENFNLTVPEL